MKWKAWIALCVAALIVLLAILWILLQRRRADIADGHVHAQLEIASTSFADGSTLPQRFTCDGVNISPDLKLPAPPTGTKSFALVVDDPDAPLGFVHWLLYNIPSSTRDIAEGASPAGKPPLGATEGLNDFGNAGYGGPCPPGAGAHHYVFRLYALDLGNNLPRGMTKSQLAAMVKGHVLAEGKISGLYARVGR